MDKLSGLLFYVLTFTGIAVAVLIIVVFAARRWFRGGQESSSGPIFTLQDLRKLRAEGDITEEEYATLRAHLIGPLADRPSHQKPPPKAPPAPQDPE